MPLLSTLKPRPNLALSRAPQRRSAARASRSGPVRVRAQVLWHLHKKGDSNVNAVIDLTDSIHDKRYVTVGDEGGAADDLSLPGVLRVGRVELAFEEEVLEGGVGEEARKQQDRGRHRALVVTDIGSEALVLVDGKPLAKKQKRRLNPGNVLSFRSLVHEEEKEKVGVESCCCEYEIFRNEFAHA